jgi:demethylmenaquinone methyltransferase/2-methoxy-6-polyprenyl-1,4-benzoquinol methylase
VDVDALLREQVAYYRERAPEYDNWWRRTEQYTLPPALLAEWEAEGDHLAGLVDEWIAPYTGGAFLELACGTGNFTRHLADRARRIVAVDAAPETIAIARTKVEGAPAAVEFVEADVFAWEPPSTFDVVFFSFWISHVPPDRFDAFWALVDRALMPGGRAVFVDNKLHDGVWPRLPPDTGEFVQVREDLTSGAAYRIVKVYYEPAELEAKLATLGWRAQVTASNRFFVMGHAEK